MSYQRKVAEVMMFANDNDKTKKLVEGVKDYLWDIFNKEKIETLESFELHIQCDGISLNGEFVSNPKKGGNFTFGVNDKDQNKIMHILKNLELYEDINVVLNYDGSFYYGHPYGVDRMSELLKGNYDEQVVYLANEYLDSEHHLYMYEESEGRVIKGIIVPSATPSEYKGNNWSMEVSSAYFSYSDSLSEEEFALIKSMGTEMEEKFGLELDYDSESEFMSLRISDSGSKTQYTYKELESLRNCLEKIVQTAPLKLEQTNLEFTYSVAGENDPFREVSITHEGNNNIVLGFYDPDMKKVKPYQSRINEIYQAMGKIFGNR